MTDTQQRSIPACPECRPDEPHFADCPVQNPSDQITQLAMLARSRRKKIHAHRFIPVDQTTLVQSYAQPDVLICDLCHVLMTDYAARQKRGRTSLRAGKDGERAIAKAYGGQRVGQYGGQADVVVGELFTVQSKAGGWFSNRYWDELAKLPRNGGRIPTLIVSDRPGPGVRTRRLVIRTFEDDLALHGPLVEKP